MTTSPEPRQVQIPSVTLNLKVAILLVGAIGVVSGGVASVAIVTGYQPEKWMLALAFLVHIGAVYVLTQLDSWKP